MINAEDREWRQCGEFSRGKRPLHTLFTNLIVDDVIIRALGMAMKAEIWFLILYYNENILFSIAYLVIQAYINMLIPIHE